MARTQQQRREDTIARLLDASIDTIIDIGYAKASAAQGGGPGAGGPSDDGHAGGAAGGGKPDDVVDADFEEVKE